jgi:hypothetical protein
MNRAPDIPLASPTGPLTSSPVAWSDSRWRTQNGHIRKDTRDVSRRIRRLRITPICSGNCVADDRACTDGKEEVEAHFVSFALSAIALISGSLSSTLVFAKTQ